ncbi:MAG: bifunctional phosphopantothenoylcysteine decarboxylase/phosphopantothenate--cysteine ligase CoaBC, partial [Alphaproteobacteria bacterium]|nr:bifunctional phosphopantothenoylcysteine decarboxylase/phosphopantothenate--cysteine ligase CoaBC [Alphaproteobacteria bacterium]
MIQALENKSLVLVISGGIAAYKAFELIRLIRKAGGTVRCVLTPGGERFITPLSAAALSENPVYTDLWSLKDEAEMGHIRLSREADMIIVAPASANMIAKMAHGMADDLATAMLLAADKPVLIAPAMNPMMWAHAATQDNIDLLRQRGILQVGPAAGDTACGETGTGRMAEPQDILDAAIQALSSSEKQGLQGLTALVTAGPTYEPIDPVRFIGNRSSGKQGFAIARALAKAGARVTLVSGPVDERLVQSLSSLSPNSMPSFPLTVIARPHSGSGDPSTDGWSPNP